MIKKVLQSYCNFTANKIGQGSLPIHVEKNFFINFFLLCLPFYFVALHGYSYGLHDHETYIPTILHLYDSSYFPDDYLLNDLSINYSFFIPVMVGLLKTFPFSLETICLAGFLIFLYLLTWTAYHITLNLFGSRRTAILASLFLLASSNDVCRFMFIDNYFAIRLPGRTFALLALLFIIRNRYYTAAVFCGLTFLIHPITAVFIISIYLFRLFILGGLGNKKKVFISLTILFFCCLPLLIKNLGLLSGTGAALSPFHLNIIKLRASYIFFSQWYPGEVLRFAAPVFLLIIITVNSFSYAPKDRGLLFDFSIICGFLFTVGFIFTEIVPNHLIIQLQLYRFIWFLFFVNYVYLAFYLVQAIDKSRLSLTVHPTRKHYLRLLCLSGITLIIVFLLSFYGDLFLISILFCLILVINRPTAITLVSLILSTLILPAVFLRFLNFQSDIFFYNLLIYAILIIFLFCTVLRLCYRKTLLTPQSMTILLLISFSILVILKLYSCNYSQCQDYPFRMFSGKSVDDAYEYAWKDACTWCRDNTTQDAVFIVPPGSRYFRIYARRSQTGNWKDGTCAIFSEAFARDWAQRMRDLQNYSQLDSEDFLRLSKKYNAQYVVTLETHTINAPVLYQNELFTVYCVEQLQFF